MAAAIAKIRIETVTKDQEFVIDPAVETILHIQDKGDGSICVYIVSYIRKGS